MRFFLTTLLSFIGFTALAQPGLPTVANAKEGPGIIVGTAMDEKSRALKSATVQLTRMSDTAGNYTVLTDDYGAFRISGIAYGYYRLKISYVGLQPLILDSIYFRAERYDFNLNDLVLKATGETGKMDEIIIYAEKPLIQSKDGNITYNAGESALSAGGSASELLTNVPLVTKDPTGKLLVRGKEPKILIDDKPVELNLQQLQDLLEAMPGSSIEKIEVMTNPPPQYAMEQGGVINITTKKGAIGMNGRFAINAGTRGELGANASFNYRKQGFSININAGAGYNNFEGQGYSRRQNIHTDSVNYFNTVNNYHNENLRPNFRANINYDLNKYHSLNMVLNYNQNEYDNSNFTENINLNRFEQIYRLSERTLTNEGEVYNPNMSFTYTMKTKKLGETLRWINDLNYSSSESNRNFFQQYFYPDHTPNGRDSSQHQVTDNRTRGFNSRINYDLPLKNYKTFLSAGTYFNVASSDISSDAAYFRKSDQQWVPLNALINDFRFRQYINSFRGSAKQVLAPNFSVTAGAAVEMTRFQFNLYKAEKEASNTYWSFLPFATLNRNWKEVLNLTFSYRRTIRRPGVGELNPTIDSADAYTIRSGNTELMPSLAHNFDLVLGKTKRSFYANLGLGYNIVDDVFSQIRTRLSDTTTLITYQNISGRKEYEVSTWSGYTFSKNWKVNLSASYTYNEYSSFDKTNRKFRNGGSLTSNFNTNYIFKELYTATGSFTYNRFANPQGSVKSTLSMNIGLQAKTFKKKLVFTFNIIDPFIQQQNRVFTYGTNFNLESYSTTQTRNFRLTVAYNFSKQKKKATATNKKTVNQAVEKVKGK